jgi:deoxyadenosine/deoxycytidine kinase
MHMAAGNISELEWATYEKFYNIMCMSLLPPTLIVYLDCTPETALERIQKRDRAAERGGLDLEYLVALQQGYNELWGEAEHGLMPWGHSVKVTTMLWDPVRDMPDWDRHATKIKDIVERRLG